MKPCSSPAKSDAHIPGVAPLVDSKDVEGLRKTYDLFDRVDALEPLKVAFAKSIEVIHRHDMCAR